ncbi:peptidase [Paracoccidioides lutzii Pb01]|uniref:Mitochondrial inner membrane protease subunit 2 n=1 Tax=Paracoccidioides lutzii (strain ATCC MYA-826 / Pb01) TaxID=502779 RepID=C1H4Y4_PARBA|nr:peptidase [Paracoccidioides lutzii Pb01]EEH34778.1 peptidase [Paracoccidioides lutzii Pb01]
MPPEQGLPLVKPPPASKGSIPKPRKGTQSPTSPSLSYSHAIYDAPSDKTYVKTNLRSHELDPAGYAKILEQLASSSSSSPDSRSPSLNHPQTIASSLQPKPPPRSFSSFRFTIFRKLARRWGSYGLLAVGGLFLLSEHVVQVMWVNGSSMKPYLNEGYEETHLVKDMILVKKWNPASDLRRGMVITFPSHLNPSQPAVKRIVALPGDRVVPRDHNEDGSQIVPWNHVWVEGDVDDTKKTIDSNTYGPVSMTLISGQVMCVLWPRLRMLRWEDWVRKGGEGAGKRSRVQENAVEIEKPFDGE